MNYIKCPNCHHQISAKSTSCLYCGITKSIIDQELTSKALRSEKELTSRVEGFYNNNKGKIVMIELLILVIISVIYAVSYLPRILEHSRIERAKHNAQECKEYGGTWDSQTSICNTEFGVITIK